MVGRAQAPISSLAAILLLFGLVVRGLLLVLTSVGEAPLSRWREGVLGVLFNYSIKSVRSTSVPRRQRGAVPRGR